MTEKLTIKEKNLELNDAKTIWIIMQRILSTKEKITQDRENLWLISLIK